ncbi:MAG TPA: SEC-C metal-binding domain-containing protein, partial [Pseudonocardia sp.]|nr:SEC-C metal-binding domain-containing protein [Pseudonocardia sp.]
SIMNRFNLPDDVPIEAGMVTKAIRSAQTQVEQQNFEIRKNVLKYDEVLNKQRTVIYEERRRVLDGEDIQTQIEHMLEDVIHAYVEGATSEGYAEDWDLDKLWTALRTIYPVGIRWQDVAGDGDEDDIGDLTKENLEEAILADARAAYTRRESEVDELIAPLGGMRELERQVLLTVIDRKWREHLYEMDYLKDGIGLRAMAQRDPLIEYQREGYDMFNAMSEGIKEETVGYLFNATVQAAAPAQPAPAAADGASAQPSAAQPAGAQPATPRQQQTAAAPPSAPAPQQGAQQAPPARQPEPARAAGGRHAAPAGDPTGTGSVLPAAFRGSRPTDLSYSGPAEDGSATRTRTRAAGGGDGSRGDATVSGSAQPSRNRPCPCGSGRKYKQCHGSPTAVRP